MKYLIRLTDAENQHMVLITLPDEEVEKSAVDVIFDTVGNENLEALVNDNIINAGQLDDLHAFQKVIFDRDEQGIFIRNGIDIFANGKPLDPDSSFKSTFIPAELEGMKYLRCDLVVKGAKIAVAKPPASKDDQTEEFAKLMFVHQIAIGSPIDVTKDYPEIATVIAWAEKANLVEIDVKKASYKLTDPGRLYHDRMVQEAQDLIKKYDIFCDVDVDLNGAPHFDTGLGKDVRVPIFELSGVDPFRARFLIGLNDGEWDKLSNWIELCHDKSWYETIFEAVEQAPSIEEFGRTNLLRILDEGKAAVRQEWQR
jgi:hypothetical protein